MLPLHEQWQTLREQLDKVKLCAFVQHPKTEGKAPSTIKIFMSAISERHKTCHNSYHTVVYLVVKTVKGVVHSRHRIGQRQHL